MALPADEEVCEVGAACSSGEVFAAGWVEGELAGEEPRCRDVLQVLRAGDWSAQSWRERAEPAVLVGVAVAGKWDVSVFDRARLAGDFGAARVKVFSPAQAALLQGSTPRKHRLSYILSKLRDTAQLLYVFDPEFFADTKAQQSAGVPEQLVLSDSSQLLTLGGPRAGTQFHTHGPAFLTLLAGRKRWYMHPPGQFPNASAKSLRMGMSSWEEKVLPKLGSKRTPLSCLQSPGDTIFVPDSWSHATVNVDETVGVAWQSFTASTQPCDVGQDYFCLHHDFVGVELLPAHRRAERLKELYTKADKLTGGAPWGMLSYLGMYQGIDPLEGKKLFDRHKEKVLDYLQKVKAGSDGAVLAAAITKSLADAAFKARRDPKEVAALLKPAAEKVPESGINLGLAQVLGSQKRWAEALVALERHLEHFPDDENAERMREQAALQVAGAR